MYQAQAKQAIKKCQIQTVYNCPSIAEYFLNLQNFTLNDGNFNSKYLFEFLVVFPKNPLKKQK
ncbi:hypothetical protein CDG61_01435 [Acinetobacter sp. WCHAc010052]|nr:hypothetical protein CDG61_01435 [Acinetobacter sp. WCHAc010052]